MLVASWMVATARADQCAWIEERQARAALEHLREGAQWAELCEPCGETVAKVHKVGKATASQVDGSYWEVRVDGQGVDLAYTYVHVGGDTGYTNLASLVGCPASGVTRRIPAPSDGPPLDRLEPWLGTYQHGATRLVLGRFFDDPNGLQVQLDHPTEHEAHATTLVLTAYADATADPVTFASPFPGCSVRVLRAPQRAVQLVPDAGCGAFGQTVSGVYARR